MVNQTHLFSMSYRGNKTVFDWDVYNIAFKKKRWTADNRRMSNRSLSRNEAYIRVLDIWMSGRKGSRNFWSAPTKHGRCVLCSRRAVRIIIRNPSIDTSMNSWEDRRRRSLPSYSNYAVAISPPNAPTTDLCGRLPLSVSVTSIVDFLTRHPTTHTAGRRAAGARSVGRQLISSVWNRHVCVRLVTQSAGCDWLRRGSAIAVDWSLGVDRYLNDELNGIL